MESQLPTEEGCPRGLSGLRPHANSLQRSSFILREIMEQRKVSKRGCAEIGDRPQRIFDLFAVFMVFPNSTKPRNGSNNFSHENPRGRFLEGSI